MKKVIVKCFETFVIREDSEEKEVQHLKGELWPFLPPPLFLPPTWTSPYLHVLVRFTAVTATGLVTCVTCQLPSTTWLEDARWLLPPIRTALLTINLGTVSQFSFSIIRTTVYSAGVVKSLRMYNEKVVFSIKLFVQMKINSHTTD